MHSSSNRYPIFYWQDKWQRCAATFWERREDKEALDSALNWHDMTFSFPLQDTVVDYSTAVSCHIVFTATVTVTVTVTATVTGTRRHWQIPFLLRLLSQRLRATHLGLQRMNSTRRAVARTYTTPKGVETGTNAEAVEARARVTARISFMMMYYLLTELEWSERLLGGDGLLRYHPTRRR